MNLYLLKVKIFCVLYSLTYLYNFRQCRCCLFFFFNLSSIPKTFVLEFFSFQAQHLWFFFLLFNCSPSCVPITFFFLSVVSTPDILFTFIPMDHFCYNLCQWFLKKCVCYRFFGSLTEDFLSLDVACITHTHIRTELRAFPREPVLCMVIFHVSRFRLNHSLKALTSYLQLLAGFLSDIKLHFWK